MSTKINEIKIQYLKKHKTENLEKNKCIILGCHLQEGVFRNFYLDGM